MKTLVAVTSTGEICCLTPLYPVQHPMEIYSGGWMIGIFPEKPLAYVLDAGDELNKQFSNKGPTLISARFLEKHVEILGEL